MTRHAKEIHQGERFAFGSNWERFLSVLNDERIAEAERSLCDALKLSDLRGKRFLDVGCGSGLCSLAARRLGATVYSFDYDPQSVACAQTLKRNYFPDDETWAVKEASVLDRDFLSQLGQFDVVYSWGVLHHTGAMWEALRNLVALVAPSGILFIAIYNNQGAWSRWWRKLKQIYNKLPRALKLPYALTIMAPRELMYLLLASLKGNPGTYFENIINYSKHSRRGMSYWHDRIDWIGGYPFEVATPEEIFTFYYRHNFHLRHLKISRGSGCNEYVFSRER